MAPLPSVEATPVEPAASTEPPTVELDDQPVDEVEQVPAPAFDEEPQHAAVSNDPQLAVVEVDPQPAVEDESAGADRPGPRNG